MTDITTKLRASLLCDAINGDQFERSVCGRQMREAADEIDRLHAELDGYREANKHLVAELDDALEDARKYCEAQREISRLREMLYAIVNRCEGRAKEIALAALAKAGVA